MERDEDEVEILAARVKKAIHQSKELIRQSKVLEVQTAVFLNQLKTEREFANYPIVHAQPDFGSILSPLKWVVKAALQITGATMGNLQLVDPASGALRIAAQYGFRKPFLDFFQCVHENQAACGAALRSRGRVIVEDVTQN